MALNNSNLKTRRKKDGTPSKGYYTTQNPSKYIGIMPISYKSSWEFAFCRFCDINDKVVKWSSESLEIPYKLTNKIGQTENHRYYPDFYLEMISHTDKEKYDRLVIEIKPKHETLPPIQPIRQTLKMLENYEYSLNTFKKNIHKWAHTKEWCAKHNLKFIIITEDDLKKKGLIS